LPRGWAGRASRASTGWHRPQPDFDAAGLEQRQGDKRPPTPDYLAALNRAKALMPTEGSRLMFDAKPEDRDQIALWVQEIVPDHKIGPDGVLVEDDRVKFGKKGAPGYGMEYSVSRLQKENPPVWEWFRPLYERWKADRKIVREGLPLDAWGMATSGPGQGVQRHGPVHGRGHRDRHRFDPAEARHGRQRTDHKAKAFLANKAGAAQATNIAELQKTVDEPGRGDLKDGARDHGRAGGRGGARSPPRPRCRRPHDAAHARPARPRRESA
jgi:hypothetical protein